jgi:hypothetical protein
MVRRLSKLGPAHSHHVYQFVHDSAIKTEALLSRRWTVFREVGLVSPALRLKDLNFIADSQISLDNSYNYLTKMLRSTSAGITQNRFTPSHGSRLYNMRNFTQFSNGELTKAITGDSHIAIADFELSVEKDLESWIATSGNNGDSLDVIVSSIEQYFACAKDLYGTNPEDTSVMILTVMDLWVALDKLVIRACPLMREYSPEIPSNFLHPLLLHQSSTIRRALHIEEYLRLRHTEALEVPSIFSNSASDSSFAVKFFCTSEYLRRLYVEVFTHAQHERTTRLRRRVNFFSSNQQGESLLGRASVYARMVVFELSPPHAFSIWRDITYMILCDIGLPSVTHLPVQPVVLLHSSSGLQRWTVQSQQRSRVTIASTRPSSFDEMVDISAEESSVFIDDELSFRLFDRSHDSWVIDSFTRSSSAEFCAPPILKSSPYNGLHRFVSGTQHTPNDITTAQADCPQEINLHEFISFSGLRSGPRLQWLNIARELASPSLSFSREEVHTLITQAAWQLGPLLNGVREWHIDLSISSFGNALLCEMECLLEKIKANWLEEVTVRTIGLSESCHLRFCLIYL